MQNVQEQVKELCLLADMVVSNPKTSLEVIAKEINVGPAVGAFISGRSAIVGPIIIGQLRLPFIGKKEVKNIVIRGTEVLFPTISYVIAPLVMSYWKKNALKKKMEEMRKMQDEVNSTRFKIINSMKVVDSNYGQLEISNLNNMLGLLDTAVLDLKRL
ncbi:hypothetical protein [Porphyromonas somerae]|uniref:hypothetical protein n=1 Tax=Porphyromonas somerae TaxID=322095 RepID=UPI00037FF611|nr:hypothetical protein [Porphyromonas somerae]